MTIDEMKRRKIGCSLLYVTAVRNEVTVKINGCITTRDVYILFGVDFKGRKTHLNI